MVATETPLKQPAFIDNKSTLAEKLKALLTLNNLVKVQKDELNTIRRNNIKSYNKQMKLSITAYINNLYNEHILKLT